MPLGGRLAMPLSSGEQISPPEDPAQPFAAGVSTRAGLFGKARGAFAPVQFGQHLGQRHVARGQHHQQVVEHIRRLGGQAVAVALHRLDDRLDRLFAEFLGAFLGAFGQQLGGPGGFGIGPLRAAMVAASRSKRSCQPHGDAGGGHMGLGLADGE
jgi:hypothetical protein